VAAYEIIPAMPEMLPDWRELAREVEPLFEAAMADDEALLEKVSGSIRDGDVFAAVDPAIGEVAGMLIVNHPKNEIAWLAVFEEHRGRGAGRQLLERGIDELDAARPVEVVTFREDNEAGIPARRLYQKFGFTDDDADYFYDGHPRCLMRRPPAGSSS
jgi:ribosomal protein S18 acetylase RimI-like enzyme